MVLLAAVSRGPDSNILSMVDSGPAQVVNLTSAAISRYADLVTRTHGVTTGSGWVDIDSLITRLGGAIRVGSSDPSALRIHHPGEFTINLPEFISRSRARLELAHGLGHYFLHYRYLGHSGEMSFTHGVHSRREVEANIFAAAALTRALVLGLVV